MAFESLALSVDDGVAHLELDRPQKANAMGEAFWRELPEALGALDVDTGVRAVVVSGRGKHFSAGIDLAMLQSLQPDPALDPARLREKLRRTIVEMQRSFTVLESCRKPVVAAIHGSCLGAGVDMVSACDIRYAAADASFAIQEINIGMVADVGTLQRAPHLLPHGLLRELAYTGRRMGAEEAARSGFVNAVAADRDAAIAMAFETARRIASKSPLAVAGTKAALNHARDHSVADGLDYVATWNAGMLLGADLLKGAQAALGKIDSKFDDLLD